MPDFSGQSFGRYYLLELLNADGMASVYRARDTNLDCDVAVRALHTENLPVNVLEPALKRFGDEAKTIARLAHENISRLLDFGVFQDSPYLVLEYLPGGSFKSLLAERGCIPWQVAVQMLKPITGALAYLHSEGVIHGELRPERILFTRSGSPKLAFFANTSLINANAAAPGLAGSLAGLGPPEYLAPEYITSTNVDARADIYALGIIFYEMICGQVPYGAATSLAVLFKHATEQLPSPSQFAPELPDFVAQAISRALEKNPEQRFASMDDFALALTQVSTVSAAPAAAVEQPGPISEVEATLPTAFPVAPLEAEIPAESAETPTTMEPILTEVDQTLERVSPISDVSGTGFEEPAPAPLEKAAAVAETPPTSLQGEIPAESAETPAIMEPILTEVDQTPEQVSPISDAPGTSFEEPAPAPLEEAAAETSLTDHEATIPAEPVPVALEAQTLAEPFPAPAWSEPDSKDLKQPHVSEVESVPASTICPKCGQAILPNHRFCTKCGEKIR